MVRRTELVNGKGDESDFRQILCRQRRMTRAGVGIISFLFVIGLVAAPHARGEESDLKLLLDGVHTIAAPGVPGPLCVFGPNAFVVAVGGAGGKVREPVVAASRLGKGRVVVLGHPGYVGDQNSTKVADTGRFLANAVQWTAGKKDGRSVHIGVYGQRHAVTFLAEQGLRAEAMEGANWTSRLAGCDAIWLCPASLAKEDEIAAVRQFVSRGGGLVAGDLGWGWLQLNPGKTLTADHQGNQLLARAGIVWADGTLERTADAGYAVDTVPPRLARADAALAALVADARGQSKLSKEDVAQAAAVVTRASRSLPAGDNLLRPKLLRVREEHQGEAVPKPSAPLTLKTPLARLVLSMQIEEAKGLPAAKVAACPAAAFFPGAVPRAAPRVTRKMGIDTAVPDWHSTSLYAPAGSVVTVEVPAGAVDRGLWVRIGAHSDDLWDHDAWHRAAEICLRKPLAQARTEVASLFGGLIYIEVPGGCRLGTMVVTVRGGVEAPSFVLGETSLNTWRNSVRQRPAPWAELATRKVILTVPSESIRKLENPDELMRFWDRVLDACADLAGRPKDRERPERYVTDVQISAGYMHSGYPLMTHLDAAAILVDRAGLESNRVDPVWGLFHEMGHNHQSDDWTFEGTGEVTVNLFSLYVLDKVCGFAPSKAREVLSPAERKKALDAYTRGGSDFKVWKEDPFLALIMYVELQEAFGWETFQKVFAEYRGLAPADRPKTDDERRDQWLVRFSRAAGRNLGPFFEAWGVPTSEKARASVAELPAWMPPRLRN
jgi:hypothetical protein